MYLSEMKKRVKDIYLCLGKNTGIHYLINP